MGQGSDTAMAQIVAEVLDIAAEDVRVIHPDTDVTPYDMGTLGSRSTFHMGHAVRARRRGRAQQARRRSRPRSACRRARNYPIAEIFQKRYGMQAGNVDRRRAPTSRATSRPTRDRPVRQRHAVLDDRRRRRRGRGRHRDRARARDQARQRRRLPARRSIRRSPRRSSRAPRSCSSASRCSRRWARRRPGHQRLARRLQDPGHPRRAADGGRAGRGRRRRTARSAPRGSASPARSASSPAIANAIDDAVGVRLTDLPLTRRSGAARAARQGRPAVAGMMDRQARPELILMFLQQVTGF